MTSLREETSKNLARLRKKLRPSKTANCQLPTDDSSSAGDFWALKDVSFDVQPGEIVGIIGKNGAGKSTLLKVISRITEPSHGEIRLRGRVAALLEVGTGFHPELTGRENIYLNGTILGMRKKEIDRKLDEIIDFSGIEKHIDTPVKRYSSGMNVRLGFAVAAHLEPEILIVDEVLAVGDAEFQKKCLGKMKDVSGQGRTVLFVSHNMGAVQDLCGRGLLVEKGKISSDSDVSATIRRYLSGAAGANGRSTLNASVPGGKTFFFSRIELLNYQHQNAIDFSVREPIEIILSYEAKAEILNVEMSLRVVRSDGVPVFTTMQSEKDPGCISRRRLGKYQAKLTIPPMLLMPGSYFVNIAAHPPGAALLDLHEAAVRFTVYDTGTVFHRYNNHSSNGVVLQSIVWEESAQADLEARVSPNTSNLPADSVEST